jgi:hypothetical protein
MIKPVHSLLFLVLITVLLWFAFRSAIYGGRPDPPSVVAPDHIVTE